MVVNSSTNINQTNNHFSPQSLNIEKTMTYAVGNPGPCLGQAQKCGRIKLVNVIPILPLLISNSNTDINNTVIFEATDKLI